MDLPTAFDSVHRNAAFLRIGGEVWFSRKSDRVVRLSELSQELSVHYVLFKIFYIYYLMQHNILLFDRLVFAIYLQQSNAKWHRILFVSRPKIASSPSVFLPLSLSHFRLSHSLFYDIQLWTSQNLLSFNVDKTNYIYLAWSL